MVLVADRAICRDLDQRYVYVLDADNKVAYRKVQTGRLHGQLRIIKEGLAPDERVIVSGMQFVRPGITVQPRMVSMPAQSGAGRAIAASP